jgi:hypothetical protein
MSNAAKWIAPALLVLAAAGFVATPATAAQWNVAAFQEADTIELRTVEAGEDPHWFPVWVVVIDEAVYVRLGNRAAKRIENNATTPVIGVRLGDTEFDRVEFVSAPDYAERVAEQMAEKYWSDFFIRWAAHPLTLRLTPAAP